MSIRLLGPDDDLEELTALIRRGYGVLRSQGFRYWGTFQSVEDTRERISYGECFVYETAGRIVGTVVLNDPAKESEVSFYQGPDVTTFHQFSVEPDLQGRGIGGELLGHIEQRARERGCTRLALDTSEGAHDLIAWYEKRGYVKVGTQDWPGTNYLSVVMSKNL